MIDSLEALLVRSFANDLLNARMERFPSLSTTDSNGSKEEESIYTSSDPANLSGKHRGVGKLSHKFRTLPHRVKFS